MEVKPESSEGAASPSAQMDTKPEETAEDVAFQARAAKRRANKALRACFEFRDTGACRNGEACEYSHDIDVILGALNAQHILPPFPMWFPSGVPEEGKTNGDGGAKRGLEDGIKSEENLDERPPKKPKVQMTCDGCEKTLFEYHYVSHINGKAHLKRVTPLLEDAQFSCETCVLIFSSHERQVDHGESILHADRVAGSRLPKSQQRPTQSQQNRGDLPPAKVYLDIHFTVRCDLCDVDFTSDQSRASHLSGKKHKRAVSVAADPSLAPVPVKMENPVAHCGVCNIDFSQETQYKQHILGKRHIKIANKPAQPHRASAWSKARGGGGSQDDEYRQHQHQSHMRNSYQQYGSQQQFAGKGGYSSRGGGQRGASRSRGPRGGGRSSRSRGSGRGGRGSRGGRGGANSRGRPSRGGSNSRGRPSRGGGGYGASSGGGGYGASSGGGNYGASSGGGGYGASSGGGGYGASSYGGGGGYTDSSSSFSASPYSQAFPTAQPAASSNPYEQNAYEQNYPAQSYGSPANSHSNPRYQGYQNPPFSQTPAALNYY